jgi:hypothetical protein
LEKFFLFFPSSILFPLTYITVFTPPPPPPPSKSGLRLACNVNIVNTEISQET